MESGRMTVPRPNRVGPWMGIAFLVLFVAGFMVIPTPDNKDTAKWAAVVDRQRAPRRCDRRRVSHGARSACLRLVHVEPESDGSASRGGMMITFGSLFVAPAMISALVQGGDPAAGSSSGTPRYRPETICARQFDQIGFRRRCSSRGAWPPGRSSRPRRISHGVDAILPGWLTIAGYVVAVLQLAAALFLPFALFPLWVLVVSIVLLRRTACRCRRTGNDRGLGSSTRTIGPRPLIPVGRTRPVA